MRFHVVALPHTQTTTAYSTCAYTEKTRKFCNMMRSLGHEVFLYASEDNEADVTELVTCITKEEQQAAGFGGPADYLKIDFNAREPWEQFNIRVITEIAQRIQPTDFICLITSIPAKPIADAFPNNLSVEYGIGYSGTLGGHRVFESYAWRHYVYGYRKEDGHFYDEVIPNSFEPESFPLGRKDSEYYFFIGRINANKGLPVAIEACQRMGKRLIVAGPNGPPAWGEYVGVVGPQERARLMGGATAVFAPTQYVGPFEGVHVEAMMCGTPVITTDWGVFTETVRNGVDGYRCKTLAEFCDAMDKVKNLNPKRIRRNAVARFGVDSVRHQYDQYFKRLSTLYKDGWYTQ